MFYMLLYEHKLDLIPSAPNNAHTLIHPLTSNAGVSADSSKW